VRVYVESIFDCPAHDVWEEVQKPALLVEIARPFAQIRPFDPPAFPPHWELGKTLRCSCRCFGIIPIGVRSVCFNRIDPSQREMETHESDPLIRRWDHLIRVESLLDGRTRYSDRIDIDAGLLTPIVWLSAIVFYRHRQRRWRKLVVPRLVRAKQV